MVQLPLQHIKNDSHNIIVVGTNDEDMAAAVNHIAKMAEE